VLKGHEVGSVQQPAEGGVEGGRVEAVAEVAEQDRVRRLALSRGVELGEVLGERLADRSATLP
jgi:hypothetical protein